MIRYCFFLVNPSGITGFRSLSRNTQNATTGSTNTSTVLSTLSLMISARFAPAIEPTNAQATVPGTKHMSTHLLFTKCHVDTAVPVADDNLFVAIAWCTGIPANIYAGNEINPPPPAIASTNPARNTSGHTIRNSCKFICFSPSYSQIHKLIYRIHIFMSSFQEIILILLCFRIHGDLHSSPDPVRN